MYPTDLDLQADQRAEARDALARIELHAALLRAALDVEKMEDSAEPRNALARIELRVSQLREALYVEKMEDWAREEALILQGEFFFSSFSLTH